MTQTYGSNREELLRIRKKDTRLKTFIESFDFLLFSMHNCSDSMKDTVREFVDYKNLELIEYEGISYTESIKKTVSTLKSNNVDKIIFLQDDSFSFDQNANLEPLINFIKMGDFNLLNLSYTNKDLKISDIPFEIISDLKVYKTNTNMFKDSNLYSFDDSPYVLTKHNIDLIYDNGFFNCGDVWKGEMYNKSKFDNLNVDRFVTDTCFFRNYGIIGRNNWNWKYEMELLKRNFNI